MFQFFARHQNGRCSRLGSCISRSRRLRVSSAPRRRHSIIRLSAARANHFQTGNAMLSRGRLPPAVVQCAQRTKGGGRTKKKKKEEETTHIPEWAQHYDAPYWLGPSNSRQMEEPPGRVKSLIMTGLSIRRRPSNPSMRDPLQNYPYFYAKGLPSSLIADGGVAAYQPTGFRSFPIAC